MGGLSRGRGVAVLAACRGRVAGVAVVIVIVIVIVSSWSSPSSHYLLIGFFFSKISGKGRRTTKTNREKFCAAKKNMIKHVFGNSPFVHVLFPVRGCRVGLFKVEFFQIGLFVVSGTERGGLASRIFV